MGRPEMATRKLQDLNVIGRGVGCKEKKRNALPNLHSEYEVPVGPERGIN